MQNATLTELSAALGSGKLSSVELTRHYLDAIHADQQRAHGGTNAFVTVCDEPALQQAAAADTQRARGEAGPLCGLPLAHKDIFCTDGILTTCGSRMLENFVAPYDATVVQQLNAAGMIMLGKTNMDEFAMGSSNESSYFGAVQNPHAIEYVPGGSSGGSAAAVAAGLAPIATGTDTGGSIRQPASFCGITGLKPTYGRVSRYGMIAFASSLDQGGPMARSAADAALLLTAMAGFDPRDSTSAGPENKLVEASNAWLDRVREQGLDAPDEPLTIGLPQQYYRALSNADCAAALQEMHRTLEAAGHRLVDIELPHTDVAIPTYYVIAGAEASTNLSRYDGVRFGHRCADPQDLTDLYERSRGEGFGAEVKRRILTGTYALSVGYYDAYYVKAQKIRRLIANDFHAAFKEVDVILAPTTPGPAFKQGELNRDPVAMYNQDKFTVPVSLAGLPALSLPCGSSQVGDAATLPLGAQLIAPAFGEERILRLAHQYQTATDWHSRWAPQNGASA